MNKIALISLVASATLFGGGYKIPENSLNSMALSAAYVANAHGADAAYYNPANMALSHVHALEVDMTYIGLSGIDFVGKVGGINTSISSETESFFVPSVHYVSPKIGDAVLGLSIVVPGGLSKRWSDQPARGYAKEFTLQVVELNPTVAYRVNERLSVGGGVRLVHSSGIVQSQSVASRDLEGESWDFGYNLALTYQPAAELTLAATYRSNVDLTEVGEAKIYFPDNADFSGTKIYDGDAEVSVPLPATLALAAAYTFENKTTLELVYERTFWSAYQELDFEYEASLGALKGSFDDPIKKDWDDTNTLRLGVTQLYNEWTVMAGLAYDETPVPEQSLNFELPDSDAWIASMGARYVYDAHWSVGAAALVDIKQERRIDDNEIGIAGDFKNARAYLVTLGVEYRF